MRSLVLLLFLSSQILSSCSLCYSRLLAQASNSSSNAFTLDTVRDSLARMEDSIVFGLIERARFPHNTKAYDPSYLRSIPGSNGCSLAELVIRESEAVQSKAGCYQNAEDVPFFSDHLPPSQVPPYNFPQFLYPAAASVNVSKTIWNMYFNELLPLFTKNGDDGNYASAVASDLVILQALSRRIHYGRFVAEVKFRDNPQDYTPLIHAKNKDALVELLTDESVEETVEKRVEKKAMVFGQTVTLEEKDYNNANTTDGEAAYKVDPSVVAQLYGEWVIPLTKVIEVDYLLHRLD